MQHRAPARPSLPASSGARSGRDRLPSLTGLRFWAALAVVAYHLSRQLGPLPVISDLAWYGRSGVTFFFVLSGFVLAWTYDGARVPAKAFLWRRFARIWPLLALTTAASVAVWAALGRAVPAKAVAASLLLVHAWVPDPVVLKGGNPAAWSLSDEAWFYLLFPALMALPLLRTSRARRRTAVLAAAGAVLVWLSGALLTDPAVRGWALDYFPLTRTLHFLLGVATGLAVRHGWRPRLGVGPAVALVACWHLLLIPWHHAVPDGLWYGPYAASQLLAAPLFALLVSAAAHADLTGRRTGLAGRLSLRLGHWSFAWYLIHEIVIRLCLAHYGEPAGLPATAALWTLALTVSLALAALAYHCAEHPLERRLRTLGPRPPTRRPRPSTRRPDEVDASALPGRPGGATLPGKS
ncbi:acyltransferase [Streptomyces sp. LP05-1]|uniref:Acyltransferase n=1 Tax=Streptomyces pyxinae TaxID=2970734 RepID=A0ABT2CNB0_9ACTN|nr:acyltransferase [Streptomyces sp. LP05-1]MCS0638074.1 acyltransferase [Streptomyces sp. LP05-1]